MALLEDPLKTKKAFQLAGALLIVLTAASVILGLLYRDNNLKYKNLEEESKRLLNQPTSSPTASPQASPTPSPTASSSSQADLLKENTDLKLENQNLKNTIADKDAKMAKAKTYNDFFKYLNDVTETHNGYTGWTETEYQTAKVKAEATGDGNFVTIVELAWTATSVPQIDRLIKVWNSIDEGIGSNLQT